MSEQEPKKQGIECPECGCLDLEVTRTRQRRSRTIRWRLCHTCGSEFRPSEKVISPKGHDVDSFSQNLQVDP